MAVSAIFSFCVAEGAVAQQYRFNEETGLYEFDAVQEQHEEQAGAEETPAAQERDITEPRETVAGRVQPRSAPSAANKVDFAPEERSGISHYSEQGYGYEAGYSDYRPQAGRLGGGASNTANKDAYETMMGTTTAGGAGNSRDDVKGVAKRSELNQYNVQNSRQDRADAERRYRAEYGYDAEYRAMERGDRNGARYQSSGDRRRMVDNEDYEYYDGHGIYEGRIPTERAARNAANRSAYDDMMSTLNGN